MLCKSCGAQIADNSVFCTNCGVRVQPVNDAAQIEAVQTENAQTEETAQTETVQAETVPAEETAQTGNVQENAAVDGQAPFEQPQMSGMEMPNVQSPYGQPQMGGMPNSQPPYGQPQTNGMEMPNVQSPYGQPQMGGMEMLNGQAPFGQPQTNGMEMPNVQSPYGQPQMNGMPNGQAPFGQPQMNGMPNGQAPFGQPQMNGMPNGQSPYGQPQMGGMPYGQALKPPKKPVVMPMGVLVVGGILAVAAAVIFMCVLLLGKPEVKKSDLAVNTLAVPAQQQADIRIGEGEPNVDLSGVTYQLDIPETDGYRAAQELAAGYLFEDSDTRYLEESDLYAYTDSELWHAYYEILAREGVDLSEIDDEEHEYFQRKNWYDPSISLIDVLEGIDEEQQERYAEMLENGEDPSYEILLGAEILNETEVYNMKLIEEYVTYGTTSTESPEDALEDMLE